MLPSDHQSLDPFNLKICKEEVKAEAEDPLEDVEKSRDPMVLTVLEHSAVKN